MRKTVSAVVLAALLTGCQTLELEPLVDETESAVVDMEAPQEVADWLLKRQQWCELEAEERRLRLREPAGDSEEARLDRVLMASCEPERTPGLLREALVAVPEQEDPALQALLNMIHDHARSYRVLEEQNAQLAEQLENTIEGIRRIEADMDHLRRNRRNP